MSNNNNKPLKIGEIYKMLGDNEVYKTPYLRVFAEIDKKGQITIDETVVGKIKKGQIITLLDIRPVDIPDCDPVHTNYQILFNDKIGWLSVREEFSFKEIEQNEEKG
jgi:hypothetical protein